MTPKRAKQFITTGSWSLLTRTDDFPSMERIYLVLTDFLAAFKTWRRSNKN